MTSPSVTPIRFVVLGAQRTGSSHLVRLLNSHSQILAYGEIFNPSMVQRTRVLAENAPPIRPIGRWERGGAYLRDRFFPCASVDDRAVGFKLIYGHLESARRPLWATATGYLIASGACVLHLVRENYLDRLISLRLAEATGAWDRQRYETPVRLSYEECLAEFRRYERQRRRYAEKYSRCRLRTVRYEALDQDQDRVIEGILDWMELPGQKLASGMVRQRDKLLQADLLTNHAELEQRFRGTRWHAFFSN